MEINPNIRSGYAEENDMEGNPLFLPGYIALLFLMVSVIMVIGNLQRI